MSTLTPETFRFLVDQIVTRRFFLTSEEGSSLRREDRKTYNEYFSVYYDVELSELLQVLLLQGNRLDADGPHSEKITSTTEDAHSRFGRLQSNTLKKK